MRILFFIDTLSAGGKERRLTELMKGLKGRPGIDFELVVMNQDVHYKELYDIDIRIHHVIRKTKKDLSVFYQFYRICKTYKPHIVHCWDSMTAVYLVPACKLLGIKLVNGMVVNVPVDRSFKNKHWARAKFTFPFSSLVVGNSEAGLQAYGVPARKSVCIYNGFNFDRIINLPDKESVKAGLHITTPFVIGMVARYTRDKDYATFYKAAEAVLAKRKDITILAIGDGTDSEDSRNSISYENREYFRLLGRRTDIEALVNIMNIGVLATFTEGISNSILEYMALGKPVIATEGGGTVELMEDGVTGYLVAQGDADAMAEKIQLLLDKDNLRADMGIAGKRRVADQFSLETMVLKYISSYAALEKNHNKGRDTVGRD